jgi:outer membrane lipoprotein-sorting protein
MNFMMLKRNTAEQAFIDNQPRVVTVGRVRVLLVLAAFGATLATLPAVSGELSNTEQIVEFASAKSTAYKSFSADFAQTINMMGVSMKLAGHMIYKQPNLLRIEADTPLLGQNQKIVCVSDSNRFVWTEMSLGSVKHVTKLDGNRLSTDASDPSSLLKNDPRRQWQNLKEKYKLRFVGNEQFNQQPMYVLEGTPKSDAKLSAEEQAVAQFTGKCRVYIGQRDGFMHKLQQFDKTGTNVFMMIEMEDVRFSKEFPGETFVYTPPEGAQVIDITAVAQQMQGGAATAPAPKE